MVSTKICLLPFAILLSMAVSSCETPYSLALGDYDERSEQSEAVITISDPQIYARGTLVNDRLKEQQLLNDLIEESQKLDGSDDFRKKFTPQIVRDVSMYQALVAQFSAAYDQQGATDARRSDSLEKLRSEIEEYKLLKQLETEKQALQTLLDAALDGDTVDSSSKPEIENDAELPPEDEAEGLTDTPTEPTDVKAIQTETQIAALKTRIDELGHLLIGEDGKSGVLGEFRGGTSARRTSVEASPYEQFRDLMAYRSELRQTQSEINLDDLHDFAGNMLYRLQFGASVLPPPEKDRLGVAELTIKPTLISDRDIIRLYNSWLAQIAHRLNQPRFKGANSSNKTYDTDLRYRRLESAALFRIVTIESQYSETLAGREEPYDQLRVISVPVRPIDFEVARRLTKLYNSNTFSEDISLFGDGEICSALNFALILSGLDSSRYFDVREDEIRERFRGFVQAIVKQATDPINGENAIIDERCTGSLSSIPQGFREALKGKPAESSRLYIPSGNVYTYSVSPIERSQRLSTVAKSANSLDLALAAAASFQKSGTDTSLATRYVRIAEGNVEARERTPIVVAFAGHSFESVNENNTSNATPQFGWVFAPPVRLNAKKGKLEYAHIPSAYRLAGDISVPGWWPSIDVLVNTKWIKNWGSTAGRPTEELTVNTNEFRVNLPLNSADLDALTNFLSYQLVGLPVQQIDITDVEPGSISACLDEVEVLVAGANVWRSSEVYLGGIPSEEIRVLPDMEGIAAKFDLKKLKGTAGDIWKHSVSNNYTLPLTVWTRNGYDEVSIQISAARRTKSGACFSQPGVSAWIDNSLDIIDISPTTIDACAKSTVLVVTTDGEPFYEPYVLLNGKPGTLIRGRDTRRGFSSGVATAPNKFNPFDNMYSIRFDGPFTDAKDTPEFLELTYVSEQGTARSLVGLRSCEAPKVTKPKDQDQAAAAAAPSQQKPETTSVEVKTNRVSLDQSFELAFQITRGSLPAGPLRLRVRPEDASYKDTWFAADTPPTRTPLDPDLYLSSFTLAKAPGPMKSFLVHGSVLKAELLADTGGANHSSLTIPISQKVVLYDKGKGAATVNAGDISSWSKPFKISLALPPKAAMAYANLESLTLEVSSAKPGISVSAGKPKLDDKTAVFELSLDEASKKALADVFSKDATARIDLNLKLSGGDVPPLTIMSAGGNSKLQLVKGK